LLFRLGGSLALPELGGNLALSEIFNFADLSGIGVKNWQAAVQRDILSFV
jgi:hypothetical protein